MDIFRVFDSLNNVDSIKFGLDTVLAANGVAEGTICYTGLISVLTCLRGLYNATVTVDCVPLFSRDQRLKASDTSQSRNKPSLAKSTALAPAPDAAGTHRR